MDLLVLASHPIQYQACIWRELARSSSLRFEVWYGSDYGVRPQPSEWGIREFTWDVDLTSGYPHRFLPNSSPRPAPSTFAGKLHPGLAFEIAGARPRAVLVQGYRNLYEQLGIIGTKLAGARLLFRADTNARGTKAGWRALSRRALLRRLYPNIDGFLAIGPDNRRHYEEHGVPVHKLYDAPYAVDSAFFGRLAASLRPERASLRRCFGLPEKEPVVLFAGALRPAKAVDTLIRAMALLPKTHLAIAGSGALRDELTTLAKLTAPERVHFLGFLNQTELAKAYIAADLFCLPSHFEPWGLVVNEAIAMGTPAVVSDVCGVAADVERAGAGLRVANTSAEALGLTLRRALENAESGGFDAGIRAFNERHHPRATADALVSATLGETS